MSRPLILAAIAAKVGQEQGRAAAAVLFPSLRDKYGLTSLLPWHAQEVRRALRAFCLEELGPDPLADKGGTETDKAVYLEQCLAATEETALAELRRLFAAEKSAAAKEPTAR